AAVGLPGPVPDTRASQAGKDKKPAAAVAKKYALLIGCSHYPNLAERFQLQGPANDVVLLRETLVKHFGFAEGNIVTLSEQQGKDRGEKHSPTRKNIEREYKALADRAGAGDHVMIFMAGHGSQQPEDPNAAEPEPDGLDEIFLPRDVGKWDDT